jgi:hypothetical protein
MTQISSQIVNATELRRVLDGCVENLLLTYRPDEVLFPYSVRLGGDPFVDDFRRPESLRYTVNTFLGLLEAARAGIGEVSTGQVTEMVDSFVRRHGDALGSDADVGLLLLVLVEIGRTGKDAVRMVDRLRATFARSTSATFDMQDLGWMIWGLAAASRADVPGAAELGRDVTSLVTREFVDPSSGMPRHVTARYRRNIVSFGSYTYFLRAMHEAARSFDDTTAHDLYLRGVRRALEIQGPQGEWPWLMDARTGIAFDVYPVFSVHQDSMAMLFLLPALDAGVPGVDEAIRKSLAWVFGANELEIEFYRYDPFFAYRSIERVERVPRLRRYVRALSYSVMKRPGAFGSASTRRNDECRSYHLGWILFAWANRVGAAPATPEA